MWFTRESCYKKVDPPDGSSISSSAVKTFLFPNFLGVSPRARRETRKSARAKGREEEGRQEEATEGRIHDPCCGLSSCSSSLPSSRARKKEKPPIVQTFHSSSADLNRDLIHSWWWMLYDCRLLSSFLSFPQEKIEKGREEEFMTRKSGTWRREFISLLQFPGDCPTLFLDSSSLFLSSLFFLFLLKKRRGRREE